MLIKKFVDLLKNQPSFGGSIHRNEARTLSGVGMLLTDQGECAAWFRLRLSSLIEASVTRQLNVHGVLFPIGEGSAHVLPAGVAMNLQTRGGVVGVRSSVDCQCYVIEADAHKLLLFDALEGELV